MSVIQSIFNQLWQSIINFLPGSPFKAFINNIDEIPYLAELNWFFPISEMIAVLQAWLAVIVVYYTYIAIMRFIRLI